CRWCSSGRRSNFTASCRTATAGRLAGVINSFSRGSQNRASIHPELVQVALPDQVGIAPGVPFGVGLAAGDLPRAVGHAVVMMAEFVEERVEKLERAGGRFSEFQQPRSIGQLLAWDLKALTQHPVVRVETGTHLAPEVTPPGAHGDDAGAMPA